MLSENLHKTEEGFLICKNVPLARPGELTYTAAELPSFEADNGKITAVRDAEDILSADTIASFEGKTVSNLHPKEKEVNAANWKSHAVGYTYNVRAGTGANINLLVADLLINDQQAINAITTRGLREVSLGYEAMYVQDGKGRVRQSNIKGNHVALVPRGRCGTLCAIQDHAAPIMENQKMSMKDMKDKMLAILSTTDGSDDDNEAKVAKLQKTVDGLIKTQEKSNEALVLVADALAKLTKTTDDDEAAKKALADKEAADKLAADKLALEAKAIDHAADLPLAEILSPGITVSATIKADALKAAYKTADGKIAIEAFTGGKEVNYTNDAEINTTFIGAANLLKATRKTKQIHVSIDQLSIHKPAAMTPAQFNDAAAKHWATSK